MATATSWCQGRSLLWTVCSNSVVPLYNELSGVVRNTMVCYGKATFASFFSRWRLKHDGIWFYSKCSAQRVRFDSAARGVSISPQATGHGRHNGSFDRRIISLVFFYSSRILHERNHFTVLKWESQSLAYFYSLCQSTCVRVCVCVLCVWHVIDIYAWSMTLSKWYRTIIYLLELS